MTAAEPPLISCLMVTRNRAALARRALRCFAAQTWPRTELVVVDDGAEDYEPVLAPFRERCTIRYERLPPDPARSLGAARNIALDLARGELIAQWDDDEWYHPDRLTVQAQALLGRGLDAVLLRSTLMHLDMPGFADHPYSATLGGGTPGTILHRRSGIRYPELPRSEDSIYLEEYKARHRVGFVEEPHSHLFIRCFHGSNTWEQSHFLQRLRHSPVDSLHYWWAVGVRRDIFTHPAFRLTPLERAAFARYRSETANLGLNRQD